MNFVVIPTDISGFNYSQDGCSWRYDDRDDPNCFGFCDAADMP